MLAVSRGDGQVPLLYLNVGQAPSQVGPQHTNASPPPTPVGTPGSNPPSNGGCAGVASAPTDVQVSADGGKTWTAAPTQGFPTAGTGPTAPLGVLSDGSVLFARCPTQGTTTTFYAWKLGDAAWQQVGSSFENVETAFVVAGAANTVCVVTEVESGYEVRTFLR